MKETLYSPVIGDILDVLGYWHQFLPQTLQPLRADMRIAGRAMTIQIADAWGKQEHPFGRMTEALDQIQPHDIYVATGGSMNCAAWGEIMTATARSLKGAGAIIDGFHRDTLRVIEQGWPVFSRGRYAQDAAVRSKVVDYRCSIEIGSVTIQPGDLIFGDLDGIVVVPRAVENEVVTRALEKARTEKVVRKDIESGLSSTDAFRKYGVL
ncbi:RraA family protein [Granulicella sp. L46]|uniref:RraA family protein n=1 Tax=Granulicella sp. L46 TaxID=1641865 RepID=UPI001C208F5D|nr:RraA family protein [Granulicella sp. L46]